MSKAKLYWPALLSLICFVIAVYFTFTNTAYVMMGCPEDTYPEAAFLVIGIPASVIAFGASILAARSKQESRPKLYWLQLATSLALSGLCIWMIAGVFVPPATSTCV
jgi:hypothetical protein